MTGATVTCGLTANNLSLKLYLRGMVGPEQGWKLGEQQDKTVSVIQAKRRLEIVAVGVKHRAEVGVIGKYSWRCRGW